MAKMTSVTAIIEVSGDELEIIRKALRIMNVYAEYDDQAEGNALAQLREDLRNG